MRTPYPYQEEGIDWLVAKGGGFLWDDPGLGKTTQAAFAAKKLGGPVLVICPNMVKAQWASELKEMFPDDVVVTATTAGRVTVRAPGRRKEVSLLEALAATTTRPNWVICHYDGVRLSLDQYKQYPWVTVIIDEAHYIKNPHSKRTQAVREVTPPSAFRIGLTATPYGKNAADLQPQLSWYAPWVPALGSYWRWYNLFVDWEQGETPDGRSYRKVKGVKHHAQLAAILNLYGLCRTKAQVAPQLPPMIDIRVPLEATDRQASVYKELRKKTRAEYAIKSDEEYTRLVIVNALARITAMQRWFSEPWQYDRNEAGSKLLWLKEWAESYPYPAVIVTAFKSAALRLSKELGAYLVSGDVPGDVRTDRLRAWTEGPTGRLDLLDPPDRRQFLVGTIHTLGTGLNLQRAHALVEYDQVHDTILMRQVRERVHRITTDHPVELYHLYVEGTVNEVVLHALERKLSDVELVKRWIQHLHMEGTNGK